MRQPRANVIGCPLCDVQFGLSCNQESSTMRSFISTSVQPALASRQAARRDVGQYQPVVDVARSGEGQHLGADVDAIDRLDALLCLVILPTRHHGRSSGIVLEEQPLAGLVTVRDGKIVRTEVFPSRERALDAVRSRD